MRAGRLRASLTIQEEAVTRDTFNGEVITWDDKEDNINLRCQVTTKSGQNGYTADQYYGKDIKEFKIRYVAGLSVKNRIVFNGVNYDIIPPIKNTLELNKELIILAEREAN